MANKEITLLGTVPEARAKAVEIGLSFMVSDEEDPATGQPLVVVEGPQDQVKAFEHWVDGGWGAHWDHEFTELVAKTLAIEDLEERGRELVRQNTSFALFGVEYRFGSEGMIKLPKAQAEREHAEAMRAYFA